MIIENESIRLKDFLKEIQEGHKLKTKKKSKNNSKPLFSRLKVIKKIYKNWQKEKNPKVKLNLRTQIFNLSQKLDKEEEKEFLEFQNKDKVI